VLDAFSVPQSIVVLGGTSDIAQGIVERLVAAGSRTVVLAGRDEAGLDAAAERARSAGAETTATVLFDATDPTGAGDVVAKCIEAAGGRADMVLMAVGILGEQSTDEDDPVRIAEMVTVSFAWPAAALGAVASRLREQGSGRIVVLSSVAGVRVRRANFIYGSAKAGLDAFGVGLSESLRGSGVKVHVVRPGFVRTKMTQGRPEAPFTASVDQVASVVVRGIELGAPVIWAPPLLRWVFGVFRLLPQAVWRRLPG
jgi:decaprenylphospho-beta-D-erythro-pentofuranosid-2-ulose 2-reductase